MNNEHIPTMPQENNRISSNKTLILDYDIEFFGEKGGNFIIISSDVISNSSGESQIYKCYRRTDRTISYVCTYSYINNTIFKGRK